MVERLYIKEYLSFEEVELFFKPSLVVFTGPSGAGKSILINALLALFALRSVEATLSEVDLDVDWDLEEYGFEKEESLTIRALKKEKVRYFLNAQRISKKLLERITSDYVSYLHQRDNTFFESSNILSLLEGVVESEEYESTKRAFKEHYLELGKLRGELRRVMEQERQREELREFLEFEIAKIEGMAPKEGEYEELMEVKKKLSKKEKIAELLQRAEGIFEYESAVMEVLDLAGVEGEFFEGAMSELRDIFYAESAKLEELEEMDIEAILQRLEELSALKRRYGSVEEALKVLDEKKKELARLENVQFEKKRLQERIQVLEERTRELARSLSTYRKEAAKKLQAKINELLPSLKLPNVSIEIFETHLSLSGMDRVEVRLSGVPFGKLSSGEYNRLRLAFLAASQKGSGILILDEIDANISGEESMAVAKILKKLSSRYQIFAISHQAQLASLADQHFLVTKEHGKSFVKELGEEERVREIARIISGEQITQEAQQFAKKLLKESV